MNDKQIAIIIPAYNEAATIASVIQSVNHLGSVIVVDDCSTDETARLAHEVAYEVLRLHRNRGYEAALTLGFAYALDHGYSYVLTMDADGQHHTDAVVSLFKSIKCYDIAIGVRLHKQRLAEVVAGWLGSLLWRVSDPFSGLKLYRISSCGGLAPFDCHRLVGGELFVRAHCSGLAIASVPIQVFPRADAPRFDTNIRANLRIARAFVLMAAIHFGLVR